MAIFYTDSGSFGDITISGSAIVSGTLSFSANSGGLTGSVLGTSSWASNAQSASFVEFTSIVNKPELVSSSGQITITSTVGYSTFSSSIATKNDLQDISITALNTATSSYAINSTIQSQLAGVVSSSTQVKTLLPADTVSSSAFTSPSQGTVRATINGAQTDVGTGLQTVDSPTFTGLTVTTTSSIAGHYSSSAQVVEAIVGQTIVPLNLTVTQVTASIISASTSLTASLVQLNSLTDTTATNKVLVLNTATNQIFTTASVGIGGGGAAFPFNATTTPAVISGSLNVSGSGIHLSGSALTGSVFSGSFFNILEMSMAVSGTITASGTTTVTLDLNKTNYYAISGSGAGTVTWVVNNPPPIGRAQTFILDYTNGGGKTNSWFTNTRWPGGVAPTLTSGSTSPDMLSFTTDDAGSNWRGVLLQRASQ